MTYYQTAETKAVLPASGSTDYKARAETPTEAELEAFHVAKRSAASQPSTTYQLAFAATLAWSALQSASQPVSQPTSQPANQPTIQPSIHYIPVGVRCHTCLVRPLVSMMQPCFMFQGAAAGVSGTSGDEGAGLVDAAASQSSSPWTAFTSLLDLTCLVIALVTYFILLLGFIP
jgi:hypothetical protein